MTCSIWPGARRNEEKRIKHYDDMRKALFDAPSMFLADAWCLFPAETSTSSVNKSTYRAFIVKFWSLLIAWKRAEADPRIDEIIVYLDKAVVWYKAFYDQPSGSNLKKLEILRLALLSLQQAEQRHLAKCRGYAEATRAALNLTRTGTR